MRSTFALVPCCILLAAPLWADEPELKTEKELTTASHGTAVEFLDTPVAAAKLAKKEKKLVLVLHVSGYFENPDCT